MNDRPTIIGLTGRMASGKTTAGKVFSRQGAYVIDVDAVGHRVLAGKNSALAVLLNYFGSKILDEQGQVSRQKLSRLLAGRPEGYQALNCLVHPLMRREVILEINEGRRKGAGTIVLDAALLFEMGLQHLCDEVWLIEAREDVLKRRLAAGYRDLSAEETTSRLKVQTGGSGRTVKVRIENSGGLDKFMAEVEKHISSGREGKP